MIGRAAMPGDAERRRRERRARRLALVCFRRRVAIAGETERGQPIIVIGTARLVRASASSRCFLWLIPCASCQREIAWDGRTVRRPSDLRAPPGSVLCDRHTLFGPGPAPSDLQPPAPPPAEDRPPSG